MTGYIYSLDNEVTKEPIYIGSTKDPKMRLTSHVSLSKYSPLYMYKLILERGIKIEMNIIEEIEFDNKKDLTRVEKYWIEQFTQWGFSLMNTLHVRPFCKRKSNDASKYY